MLLRPLIFFFKTIFKTKIEPTHKIFWKRTTWNFDPLKGYVGKRLKISPSPIKTNTQNLLPLILKINPFFTNSDKSKAYT